MMLFHAHPATHDKISLLSGLSKTTLQPIPAPSEAWTPKGKGMSKGI
jgi:hypothetical protein